MTGRCRVAVLISGRGSNMAALIEAAKAADYPAEIALVVASTPAAAGLATARAAGVATDIVRPGKGAQRAATESALDARLRAAGIELVALAGYMRILSEAFVERWKGRLINIHPSLLPEFPGLDTHARAIQAGAKNHGCTVHHVVADVDAGPIISQAKIAVAPDDTPESLAARVLAEEHRLYPEALARVARSLAADDRDINAAPDGRSPAAS